MSEEGKIEALADKLRERIKRGDFGTTGRLPTVTALAKEYQIARATMYQSLLLLRSEGWLIVKDVSYFARYPLMRIPPEAPLFDQFLLKQGITPVTDHLAGPEIVPAPADIAALFGLREGAHVLHRTFRQGTAEVPYSFHENWYPGELAEALLGEMKEHPDRDMAELISETHGITIATLHNDVIARLPTADEINLLNIVRTTPVLEIRKQFRSQEGVTVIFVKSVLVGAYFQLSHDSPYVRGESAKQTKE